MYTSLVGLYSNKRINYLSLARFVNMFMQVGTRVKLYDIMRFCIYACNRLLNALYGVGVIHAGYNITLIIDSTLA